MFDEVDANVGGEIGAEVGKRLAELSKGHQVFCVTHLPQVAACANGHFLVEKFQTKTSTSVSIARIDGDKKRRVSELARMLGDRNSESAVAHATKLLDKKILTFTPIGKILTLTIGARISFATLRGRQNIRRKIL